MLANRDKLQLVSNIAKGMGSTFVAVFNDIDKSWYYYVGSFKPRNPSNHIHFNFISGKCINYIFENEHVYFNNNPQQEAVITKIQDLPKEEIEFDFRFIWFK